jgi:hypothetical protein
MTALPLLAPRSVSVSVLFVADRSTSKENWVRPYNPHPVYSALWLGPCDQSFLLRCIMSPSIAIAMLRSGSEYGFSGLRKLASFRKAIAHS